MGGMSLRSGEPNPPDALQIRPQKPLGKVSGFRSNAGMKSTVRNLCLCAVLICRVSGQEYLGAEAVLRQIAEADAAEGGATGAQKVGDLREKIKTLRREGAALPPAEAANRWLALLQGYLSASSSTIRQEAEAADNNSSSEALSLADVLSALPPSAVWDEIGARLARRTPADPLPELLVSVLRGDKAAETRAFEALKQAAEAEDKESGGTDAMAALRQFQEKLEPMTAPESGQLAIFEKRLMAKEKEKAKPSQPQESFYPFRRSSRSGEYLSNLTWGMEGRETIPDLARLAGEEKAAGLLTRALAAGTGTLPIEGAATQRLAAKLALEQVDHLPEAPWGLVQTLEDAALFEALVKKFPADGDGGGWERSSAAQVYIVSLIAKGRPDDAWAQFLLISGKGSSESMSNLKPAYLEELGAQGLGKEMLAFYRRMLGERPEMPFWRNFIDLSAHEHRSAEALKFMTEILSKPELKAEAAAEIGSQLSLALLAADEREEGIRVLRELVRAGRPADVAPDAAKPQEEEEAPEAKPGVHIPAETLTRLRDLAGKTGARDAGKHLELCSRLAEAGRLLQRPEWIAEALDAATVRGQSLLKSERLEYGFLRTLVTLLSQHGRSTAAEKLLTTRLESLAGSGKDRQTLDEQNEAVKLLTQLYGQAGRSADVLLLLERAPFWETGDLVNLDWDLWLPAARALAAAGRGDDARRVLRRYLREQGGGNDRAYELLLEIGGETPEILAELDSLAAADHFEERPLIWKARLLLDQGKTDEAENAARAAIAIDPSDGEQGKGDRMRAYAVLAEALEKKGDAENAKILHGAVSAIRKSEDADDWWAAGFLSEALRRYESSLTDFADAYCVQSRLALRYSEQGDDAKAEEHYLRAFELMPDSFGRVESHCFGCEGAFASPRAQNAAERVFTRLAAKPPVKAQVHYLLGYLRQAQGRNLEAAESYREAVRTDPEYLNAWRKLAALGGAGILTQEESDKVAFTLLRLAPQKDLSVVASIRNLRQMWDAVPAWQKSLSQGEKGPLLPLPAAAARIEAFQKNNPDSSSFRNRQSDFEPDLLRQVWEGNGLMKLVTGFIGQTLDR